VRLKSIRRRTLRRWGFVGSPSIHLNSADIDAQARTQKTSDLIAEPTSMARIASHSLAPFAPSGNHLKSNGRLRQYMRVHQPILVDTCKSDPAPVSLPVS
jgi:hypothetical protein